MLFGGLQGKLTPFHNFEVFGNNTSKTLAQSKFIDLFFGTMPTKSTPNRASIGPSSVYLVIKPSLILVSFVL